MNFSESDFRHSTDASVCMLSPWETDGGVSWYCEQLVEKLEGEGENVDVLKMEKRNDMPPSRFYALGKTLSERYDLLHFQYTPGWFGSIGGYFWGSYLPLLDMGFDGPTVLTMHEYDIEERNRFIEGIQLVKNMAVANVSERVIVHSSRARKSLQSRIFFSTIEELFFPVDNEAEI
ncbi:MAG: hypothetical protein ABEI86_00190, partial [Halobacteriaceae archaeon]